MSVSHKHACGNVNSYDPNKVRELLLVTKCLFERLIKDVSQYTKELSKFQDYYQRYDIVGDANMYPCMLNRLTYILTLFYFAFYNHLSTKTNVRGIGEQIIKVPWCDSEGNNVYSTTIRYQNVIKLCNDCDKCRRSNKPSCECGCGNSYSGNREYLRVQSTINVATYDNVSISQPVTSTSDGTACECTIQVGNLSYLLTNFPVSILSSPSDIYTLYSHVDKQIKILSSLENALETNVSFINKYLCKFNTC